MQTPGVGVGFITADLETEAQGGTAWLSEVSQPVAAALLGAGVSESRSRSLLLSGHSPSASLEQGAENQRLQGPPQLPDSPDLSGYWLSQASAGALRVAGRAIKNLGMSHGNKHSPEGFHCCGSGHQRASWISEYNW